MYTATDLEATIGTLAQKDQIFAAQLIVKARRYGASEKQAYWIDRLTKTAKGELAQPERPRIEIGSLTAVNALFAKAGEKLAHPKIMLRVRNVSTEGIEGWSIVKLSIAGPKSKHPGSVNVTSEGSYGNNTWYGRVGLDGRFCPSKDGERLPALVPALQALAAEPAKVAAEYGKWRGACCFCSRQLDDKRSTEVGYGPNCAEHYGLPWGTR